MPATAGSAKSKRPATRNAKPKQTSAGRAKPKAGRSKAAAAARRVAFVETFLINGHNATHAAYTAGFTGKQLARMGWSLLQEPAIKAAIAERSRAVAELAEMTTANWAQELRAILFSRIGDLYGPDGSLLPVHMLPAHVQAAIAAVKMNVDGSIEYKFWNKTDALTTAARHLGLFEKDNAQLQNDIRVRIELVG